MGKDLKIKHSVSSSNKIWENFFRRKALHGGTNFFGQISERMFYMGTNNQIKLIVKRFQRSSQVNFSSH